MTEKDREEQPRSETFYPTSKDAWREWLQEHHLSKPSIWLLCYKQRAGVPTISWSDAVDEALCFGWIDSTRKSLDNERFIQFFTKRKPTSTWSKINKDKVEVLVAEGKMAPAGLEIIEKAKQNGSWTILDSVEALLVPDDLELALAQYPEAKDYFDGLSKSVKKMMLYHIISAKTEPTRQKRIQEIAEHASRKTKPKQF